MKFDIITIFPAIFKSFANEALIARAQAKKIISINAHQLRDSGEGPHKKVDDRPYGGGVGMVLMALPIPISRVDFFIVYIHSWMVKKLLHRESSPKVF